MAEARTKFASSVSGAKDAPSTYSSVDGLIALLALSAIAVHLLLRFVWTTPTTILGRPWHELPLYVALILGGIPLVAILAMKLIRFEFSSDLLAGIAIVTAVLLDEYLAGTLVVLMLSGGQALEAYAVRSASSVLHALAKRMPTLAHRLSAGTITDVALDDVQVGDVCVVLPHEICPVDGTVLEGHGSMDESYLTGEPFIMSKAPGANVLSGSINGASALTIRADQRAEDSRYAKIMAVMRETEQRRPRLRRLGDQLGAIYTPIAVGLALAAWIGSGEPIRFLAVLVVATPCPLLIGIPVAIIGSISLAARRGIIIKNPAVLEKLSTCETAMFDKTGTLTYGQPHLTEIKAAPEMQREELLRLAASLEVYSRHPLAHAVVQAAKRDKLVLHEASAVSEKPGQGLRGTVAGNEVVITSRKHWLRERPGDQSILEGAAEGLECIVGVNGRWAGTLRFRDEPRDDGEPFIRHLTRKHRFRRILLVSGDRASEVQYLADKVGIPEVHAGQSPEQKLELVRRETAHTATVFLGDGINDAPALMAATVGIAFGQGSDITMEAADAVILESSLQRVDELLHIGQRMRTIALQSAVGGMALSIVGMVVAAFGYLPPVAGAVVQEIIDVLAVANALRAAVQPSVLTDYSR